MTLVALHIHLTAGLREGEVVGTETHDGLLAVDLLHHGNQSALQIAHGDVFIHHQTFDLMEHGGVGGICLVFPEHPAGSQHTEGGLVVLHEADLHGAGLGTQQNAVVIGEVEGVAAIPGGMTLFDIQTGEVVVGQLNLGAVHHLIAQTHENLLDLLQNLIHGMLMADGNFLAGNGHIDGFAGQLGLQSGAVDGSLPLLQLCLDISTNRVCQLTHNGTLLGAELTHQLQDGSQLTLFAQQLDPQLLQHGGRFCLLQGCQSIALDLLQLFFHFLSSYKDSI